MALAVQTLLETLALRILYVEELAAQVLEQLEGGAWKRALEIYQESRIQGEELLAFWSFFPDPMHRAWLEQKDRKYIREYLGMIEE